MSETLRDHPIVLYFALVLPSILLGAAILLGANLFLILVTLAWIGVSFIILFIPIASDSGSSL